MVIANLSVCLTDCPQSQGNSDLRKIWPPTAPDVDVHTARIDSGHTYKQPGPTFGFNGALRLELRDPASPGGEPLIDNRLCQGRYEQRSVSQIGYCASIVTKVGSPYRSMARSAPLANGVKEVVARRLQTAVQGIDPMGFAIYSMAFVGGVPSCSTVNRNSSVSHVGCGSRMGKKGHNSQNTAALAQIRVAAPKDSSMHP